jgi:hypothetical protein
VGTEVKVHADWIDLNGKAVVRRITPGGGVFQLGLELDTPLPGAALMKILAGVHLLMI